MWGAKYVSLAIVNAPSLSNGSVPVCEYEFFFKPENHNFLFLARGTSSKHQSTKSQGHLSPKCDLSNMPLGRNFEGGNPPQKTTILVIGGGPAGSFAASALQREGHQVVLLESAKFPRYHVGESMLPSLRNYLRFIGMEEEFVNHGFLTKPGATFKLVQGLRDSWTDFTALGPGYGTWNVIRSEMDNLMLRHAEKEGVQVFEETRVESIDFEGEPASSRPIAAHWTNKQGGSGKISFDWLVDASGRAGVMSTKYLQNREMRETLRNVAVWGYWKDCKRYAAGTKKANSAWFEAMTDESGWMWGIPLHDGTTSVGAVMHQNASNAKKAKVNAEGNKPSLTEHYLDQLQFGPGVREIIGDKGHMIPGSVKSAADYSYFASRYSGDHFRIIGDAANFIDPFFSSGVHIAMTGGLAAAATICASMKGEVDEQTAQNWHDTKVGIAHTRQVYHVFHSGKFLFVVLGAYKQMRLQSIPVLSDVNADNFDHAFEMFRPVIYGLADSSKELTDAKVLEMMEICQRFFDPLVNEDDIKAARERYGEELITMQAPVLGRDKIEELVHEDEKSERVLRKFDALKVFRDDVEATYMSRHPLLGYVAKVERGNLGLMKAPEKPGEALNGSATTADMYRNISPETLPSTVGHIFAECYDSPRTITANGIATPPIAPPSYHAEV
ncbi:putative halogenase [Serpula lacrymans var. lacrymans S7.9]|uniref:Putative halogenase n=1 Tax=Serpula lacrymans var. lacrymans (strain S7.9) TaxID=578457 RepID=F8PCM3_SERL9|nr:putative halogenase [Serpula lacrymans var. lacrymans S7.9]EGO19147.1 putative halogenase [Serpula lacrymans var. lacrymans S7.9]